MTSRGDLRRLGASLAVLGTLIEDKGATAWDRFTGWEAGPQRAPQRGVTGGGGGEAAAAEREEERRQAARAARLEAEWRTELNQLDALVQSLLTRIDLACPPNPDEVKNRRTGELDPITPAEAAVAGWCSSCWRHDQACVPITTTKAGLKYYRDLCRPCGDFQREHGILPPREVLEVHLDGKHMNPDELDRLVARDKAKLAPPKKGKRGRKGKRAA